MNAATNGRATREMPLPPHNLEAEKSVLGAVLLDERHLYGLVADEQLRPEHFFREQHGAVFAAMLRLHERARRIDHLTVAEALREDGNLEEVGGAAAIDELAGWVPAAGHAREYGRIVRNNALLRALLRATYEIQSKVAERRDGGEELIEEAERLIFALRGQEVLAKQRLLEHAIAEELERLEQAAKDKRDIPGLPTGISDLDRLLGGLQDGRLYVVAARPAMGKSLLVLQWARHVALRERQRVLFASLEMSDSETAQRHLAAESGVDPERLHLGKVTPDDWPALLTAATDAGGAPFHLLDDGDLSLFKLRAQARQIAVRYDDRLRLIIVDYLQLMKVEQPSGSRVEDVSEFSRGLKRLAREMKCPVLAVAQLSRAVEQRPDKRPVLSDLRECVTGDTRVALADGRHVPIADLCGTAAKVIAITPNGRLTTATTRRVWRVGTRVIWCVKLASGRSLRATAKHRVLGWSGWMPLSELRPGDRVALARRLPDPRKQASLSDAQLVLLGHLIGDGSYSRRQPIRYTTVSQANLQAVMNAAREIGCAPTAVPRTGRTGWEVRLGAGGNRWHPRPLRTLLSELGMLGQTASTKHVPDRVFCQPEPQLAIFLKHLWATDGSIWLGQRPNGRTITSVYYSSISAQLAEDVALLLLRLGIVSRIKVRPNPGTYQPNHHVIVSGGEVQRRFLEQIGTVNHSHPHAARMCEWLSAQVANTNADTIPVEVWNVARERMRERKVTQRQMAALRGTAYGGTSHLKFAPSRDMVASYAAILDAPELGVTASNDLYWDSIVAIEPAGEQDVFDLQVPGPNSWIAGAGIVSHNSGQIEADADCVLMLYRDDYYDPDSERPGELDILVRKNRQGRLGVVTTRIDSRLRYLPIARDGRF
ncbi:MAG: replicative DNA helicase [Solirubrobacterales bacterium]|nr:replicative DNA helicase [Solirubrobacterales bacterium]